MTRHDTTPQATDSRVQGGVWRLVIGPFDRPAPPALKTLHLGAALPGLRLSPVPGDLGFWDASLLIPAEMLGDRVQTILLRDIESGRTLARLAIAAGDALSEDVTAELAALRAEIEVIKAVLRRTARQTAD